MSRLLPSMNRTLLSSLLLTQVGVGLLAAPLALAQEPIPSIVPVRPTGVFGELVVQEYTAPARDLAGTIRFIINFVLGLVGVLALAALVYGGFRYVTSLGNEDAIEAAKGAITNAIIGIIVIAIAAAVVNFFIGAVLVS